MKTEKQIKTEIQKIVNFIKETATFTVSNDGDLLQHEYEPTKVGGTTYKLAVCPKAGSWNQKGWELYKGFDYSKPVASKDGRESICLDYDVLEMQVLLDENFVPTEMEKLQKQIAELEEQKKNIEAAYYKFN